MIYGINLMEKINENEKLEVLILKVNLDKEIFVICVSRQWLI